MTYWFWRVVLTPVVWLLGRPTVVGRQHIPRKGPAILAGNHLTVVDSFFLCLIVPRRVTFVAKSEYFTRPGFKGALQRWFFGAAGQIPIDRNDTDAALGALSAAARVLRGGGVWAIYPEGTRSPDGRLYRGRTGAVRVALETGAPLIPVAMRGTERINPPGSRMWRPGKVRITVCPPLDLSAYRGRAGDRQAVRQATDQLMTTLARASGQAYVGDVYAADLKRQTAPERRAS